MKRLSLIILALMTTLCFCILPVGASSYYDQMNQLDNQKGKQYYNLTPMHNKVGWATSLKDSTFMALASTSNPMGSVVYQVQNASQINVDIYSPTGTMVSTAGGKYGLGHPYIYDGAVTGLTAYYSPSYNDIFVFSSQWCVVNYDEMEGYVFVPTTLAPTDLIPYGINIYASRDGINFSRLNQRLISYEFDSGNGFCWERWTASVPFSPAFLKVEINDSTSVGCSNGSTVPKISTRLTMLAQVEIVGSQIIIGEPEPIIPEEELTAKPESSQAEEPQEKKKKPTKYLSPEAKTEESNPQKSVSEREKEESSPASKFEGQIDPNFSKKSTTPKTTKKAGGSTKAKAASKEQTSEKEESSQQDEVGKQVYYVEKPSPQRDNFQTGVIVYIAVMSVAVIAILLKQKK